MPALWDREGAFVSFRCDGCNAIGPGIHCANNPAALSRALEAHGWMGVNAKKKGDPGNNGERITIDSAKRGTVYFEACGKRCAAGAPPPPEPPPAAEEAPPTTERTP